MKRVFRSLLSCAVWCGPALVGLSVSGSAEAQVSYSGRAVGAFVAAEAFADTGELPPSGGLLSAALAQLSMGSATGNNLAASASGGNNAAQSSASLEDGVIVGVTTIQAASIRAEATAACTGAAAEGRGTTTIVGLTVDGVPVDVTGEVAQEIALPDGTLLLNRQSGASSGTGASIVVTALSFLPREGLPVLFAQAEADIEGCTATPPADCHDFVTGGGWVAVGGDRANFGFNAGFKPNSSTPAVHFNYIDHQTGMHVKATTIETYEKLGPTTRRFTGTAMIDGAPASYAITVTDNGEPGSDDTIVLTLSSGYEVSGTLQGGNIQLHKPCE